MLKYFTDKHITMKKLITPYLALGLCLMLALTTQAQIGRRFPSEKKIVKDPVTGTMLTFLTSTPAGDAKIYQTHPQWTSDGQWLVFRSNRARNEALAVNEKTGDIVQITEGGYTGMLNLARKSMKLYLMRNPNPGARGGDLQIVEVDLARVFADSKAGKMQPASYLSTRLWYCTRRPKSRRRYGFRC
jgi:oligogalacturonide lyase